MKIIYYLFILNLCIACNFNYSLKNGNGNIVAKEVNVDNFSNLSIGGNYDVNLIPSNQSKVVIETDENLQEYIFIENNSNELKINSEHDLNPTEGVKVEIYFTKLDVLKSIGASNIKNSKLLDTENLDVEFSGAGNIKLNLRVEDLNINLSGAGLITLTGYAENQTVHLSGAGALESQHLESQVSEIFISGIGNAKVKAIEELNATISGLGNVEYYGTPKNITKNVSGLGKIKRATEYIENEKNQ